MFLSCLMLAQPLIPLPLSLPPPPLFQQVEEPAEMQVEEPPSEEAPAAVEEELAEAEEEEQEAEEEVPQQHPGMAGIPGERASWWGLRLRAAVWVGLLPLPMLLVANPSRQPCFQRSSLLALCPIPPPLPTLQLRRRWRAWLARRWRRSRHRSWRLRSSRPPLQSPSRSRRRSWRRRVS